MRTCWPRYASWRPCGAGWRMGTMPLEDRRADRRYRETLRRRLAFAVHALIGKLDRRGLAGRLVMGTTSAVLQGLLRLSPSEAKERVTAARACGVRASLTGEP